MGFLPAIIWFLDKFGPKPNKEVSLNKDKITLSLEKDEAFVLFAFLSRFSESGRLTIEDSSEKRVLWDVCAGLESSLVEPLSSNWKQLLEKARAALKDSDAGS